MTGCMIEKPSVLILGELFGRLLQDKVTDIDKLTTKNFFRSQFMEGFAAGTAADVV